MKSLIFSNVDKSCYVEYKTDLIGTNDGLFTVMEIKGLDDNGRTAGLDFSQLTYTVEAFKSFATDNNLKLESLTQEGASTLVALGTALAVVTQTADLGAGVNSTAEVTDITCVADTANSLDGKYFTFDTPTGGYYVWYNTSGGSAVDPEVASRTGIEVAITTGDTANSVATATKAAITAAVSEVTITGSTSHVIITNDENGTVTDANVGTSGFSRTVSTQGSNGTVYSETLEAEGGNIPYTWEVSVGSLPAGLSLDARSGVISGTPTVAATTTFTVKVTDVFGVEATEELEITTAA